jgi:hypothetical protein
MKWLATLSFLIFLSVSGAMGKDGRGFTGFYQARGSSGHEATVRVTLAVRVFNSTSGDVSEGSLRLRDSLPPHRFLGSITGVFVNGRGNVLVTGEFEVPQNEFERWQRGGRPDLTIEFQNSAGKRQSQTVELKRGRVGNEE